MKVINVMNFVRATDWRCDPTGETLLATTKSELETCQKYGVENTFLLQYDAVVDERYINLFKYEADATTELGLWYEIVRELTDKAGLPWKGFDDSSWHWYIDPDYPMAYTQEERKLLADAAMDGFRDVYGYYPKSVGSWFFDAYTMEYMSEKYGVQAFAICRDQMVTDAYTLVGGYFNQGYYPSKKNMFTPAQTKEMQIDTPVFRLLGPCPIHSYANKAYKADMAEELQELPITLETALVPYLGHDVMDWFYKTYFVNEDLGFSYAQIGQENSFNNPRVGQWLGEQIEIAQKYKDVKFMKMCDTGVAFKEKYSETPATAVSALDNWVPGTEEKLQSVIYDCKNYSANAFRCEKTISLRFLYLFDERIEEKHYSEPCHEWEEAYENLPIVDTWNCGRIGWRDHGGIIIDTEGAPFTSERKGEGILEVAWGDKSIVFEDDKMILKNVSKLTYNAEGARAIINARGNEMAYYYKGHIYSLIVENGQVKRQNELFTITTEEDKMVLTFSREK